MHYSSDSRRSSSNGANTRSKNTRTRRFLGRRASRNKSAVREKIVDSLLSGDPVPKNSQLKLSPLYVPLSHPLFKRETAKNPKSSILQGIVNSRFKRCGKLVAIPQFLPRHSCAPPHSFSDLSTSMEMEWLEKCLNLISPPREKIENFVTNVTRNFCLKMEEFFTLVNINFSTSTRIKKDRIVKSGTHIKSNIGNLKDFLIKVLHLLKWDRVFFTPARVLSRTRSGTAIATRLLLAEIA